MSNTYATKIVSPPPADAESQPLLRSTAATAGIPTDVRNKLRRTVILMIFVSMFALGIGGFMEFAPQTTIFEAIICKEHYDRHTVAEGTSSSLPYDCKIEPVQSRLAMITGWKDTLDQVPGILLALPYGFIADRYGRKPVYVLGLLGWLLEASSIRVIAYFPETFPLWLVWTATAWPLLGGGLRVMISMLFTMLADVSTPEERTTLFSRAMCTFLLSQIISMTGTAAFMQAFGPWPPYLTGIGFYLLSLLLACCVPETRDIFRDKSTAETKSTAITNDALPAARNAARNLRARLADASHFIHYNSSVCILIGSTFCGSIAVPAMQFLMIYIPRRFPPWSIAQASTLVSLRAFLYLVLLAAGLPAITHVFHRRLNVAQGLLDLRIAQLSSILLCLSLFMIGLSSRIFLVILSIVLFSLGSAMDLVIRSVATTLVSPDRVAALFTSIAVVESVAVFFVGPGLAALFKWGMLLGNEWQGLPFFATATLLLVSSVALLFVRLPKRGEMGVPPEESVDEHDLVQELYI